MANIRTNMSNASLTRPVGAGKRVFALLAGLGLGYLSFSAFSAGSFWLGLIVGGLALSAFAAAGEAFETLK